MNEEVGNPQHLHFPHIQQSQVLWRYASVHRVTLQNNQNIDNRTAGLWTLKCCWAGGRYKHVAGTKFNDAWIYTNFTRCAMKINLRDTTSKHILRMHSCPPPHPIQTPTPCSLFCRPVQYIHHSFINSENSSLVNCLGKFNFKWKLLKEKDIIKLQGSFCPLLAQGLGWGGAWGHELWAVQLCSVLHCSVSGKSYTHV